MSGDPCDACGACCREQESPPGYVAILAGIDWPEPADIERVQAMPESIRVELRAYAAAGCVHDESPACLWYDATAGRCRHYEWRPETCREFEAGSDECRGWRTLYQIEEK